MLFRGIRLSTNKLTTSVPTHFFSLSSADNSMKVEMKAQSQQIASDASDKMKDLSEDERYQIRLSRVLKEFALRRKRRAQGIWYDEENHFGHIVKCNYIREVTMNDKRHNKDFTMMTKTVPFICGLAILIAIAAQWNIFHLKKDVMNERQMERLRRKTMPGGNVKTQFDKV